MRKKLVLATAVVLATLSGGVLYWQTRPKPALETKFSQQVRDSKNEETGKSRKGDTAGIKESGQSALVDNPTHIYQTFNNCGPATLTMILNRLGEDVGQKELGDKMRPYQVASGDNDDKTIFTSEFVDWAKAYGYEAVGRVNGDIELLKTLTANGIPVVVKTWLHPGEDIGHFRIVRGYDEDRQVIIQDDSYEGPNKKISYWDFLTMWQPFNYAYIVVYTPDQAPLIEAIVGDEVNESVAWENALARAKEESQLDPDNVYPWFNMATAYYHLGEYENSVAAFERVESSLPRRMMWYQIEPIQSYFELQDYDRVFQLTQNILDNGNRAYSELYQIRGETYLAQGDESAAREEFAKALVYNENYTPAQDALESL